MNLYDLFNEEKVRLDPKCWTGKKIGNPKTKVKGGTRVNNCVPAESVEEGSKDLDKSNSNNSIQARQKKADDAAKRFMDEPKYDNSNQDRQKKADDAAKRFMQGVAENAAPQLSVQQLATISDTALDQAYGYGRSTPGNTFGWQANMKSAAYAKQMIDQGVTDIEAISDAIHKGWNTTAQAFVQDPEQFDDTAKLAAAGKLEAKLQQRAQLMKQNYAQLPEEEKEKDRVVARALLQAIRGEQPGMAEGVMYGAENLQRGDPVVITGNVEFEGKTGDIVDFGQDKRFVVVNLYNHGRQSFHSSDVSYNDYAGSDDMDADDHDDDMLNEKSVSQAQFRTMAGAAHNPKFAQKVGISQDVAQEFNRADKKSNYKKLPARATEGEQQPGADYRDPKEVDYDDEYDAMVARVKKLAGLGPMKTVYDPAKRVYRNVPTAQQPKK